jgi:eukaryotic-like serine/threonine-protein kinase
MAATSPSAGDRLGHFRLIEQIGAGGMGIVYRARDERLQRDVAVKVLNAKTRADRAASRRFHREALILGRLNHPNVEAVYDFHSEHGLEYLVIEYVAGTSLDDRLQEGALSEKEVIALGLQLARGLGAAHAHGIIHRDLKPGNLRVTPENILKILDFGLAQLFAAPDAETLTEAKPITMRAQNFAGTLAYMAPEQLERRVPDTRSDIYSAGVVLYELATGTRPFPQHGQVLWDAILHSLPLAPRIKKTDISAELEAVILKCLTKDPTQRYQSAEELLTDLSRIGEAEDETASAHQSVLEFATRVRKRWIGIMFLAILLVGIAAGILIRKRFLHEQMQPKLMAVLPIDTLGQDPETSALGLGLTETVTTKLVEASDIDAVQVVSPRDLRDKGVRTAEDARREFGTNLVVESSLQRSGKIIRINCYLVDSKTHGELAAKSIEAEVNDPFGLQDRVVGAVLDMLPVRIKSEQRRNFDARKDTQPAAYEAYILGRGYLQEYEKPENIDNAIAEFNQALKVDSNYAPAYAGLGEAYWIGFQQPMNRGKEWLTNASRNCAKALALDPQFAEGYTCLGNVLIGTGRYEEAVKHYQHALQLDPNSDYALGQLADAYQTLGNSAAAESAYQNAIALRPSYWGVYSGLGVLYFTQARYSEASNMFSKVIELAPNNYHGYSNLAAAYLYMGRYADSIAASERSIELRPNRDAYANLAAVYFSERQFAEAAKYSQLSLNLDPSDALNWGVLGDALYWTPGRRSEAADAYHKAIVLFNSKIEVNPRDSENLGFVAVYNAMIDDKKAAMNNLGRALAVAPKDADVLFKAAFVYSHLGDTDQALTWLKKALNAGYPKSAVRDTPEFDHLLTDPRFQGLMGSN